MTVLSSSDLNNVLSSQSGTMKTNMALNKDHQVPSLFLYLRSLSSQIRGRGRGAEGAGARQQHRQEGAQGLNLMLPEPPNHLSLWFSREPVQSSSEPSVTVGPSSTLGKRKPHKQCTGEAETLHLLLAEDTTDGKIKINELCHSI